MSVFANPFAARHVSYSEYLTLSPTALNAQLAKGGWVISSTAGWGWPSHFFLKTAWDAISPADQKTMIDSGDVVMVTEN